MISPESLQLLRNILANQVLRVGDPEFLSTAALAARALAELDAALANLAADTNTDADADAS